jgi:hypothetical protein
MWTKLRRPDVYPAASCIPSTATFLIATPDALHRPVIAMDGDGLTAATEANFAFAIHTLFAIRGTVIVPVLLVVRTFADVNANTRNFDADLRTCGCRSK